MHDKLFKFLQFHFLGLMLLFVVLVLSIWLVGVIANGFFETKVDLSACTSMFTAVSVSAATGMLKYWIDSTKNSNQGEMPYRFERRDNDGQ